MNPQPEPSADEKLLARAENDPASLSDSDVAELASALRRANEEVMAHQVGDGYQKGYTHGTLAATKRLVYLERKCAEVERALECYARPGCGSRIVTDEDRREATIWELIERDSQVRITPGMVRGLRRRARWRGFWRGVSSTGFRRPRS